MMRLYHLPHRLRLHWNLMWYFPMCSLVPVMQFYFHDSRLRRSSIDPLHVTSHSGHVRILSYDSRHFGGQECIAVIERKVLIVSLFANASDYSNKTCIYKYYVLASYKKCKSCWSSHLRSSDMISTFLSITAIHFCPPT